MLNAIEKDNFFRKYFKLKKFKKWDFFFENGPNSSTGNAERSKSEEFATTKPTQEPMEVSAKENRKLPYWDDHSWALEQLDKSEDIQWFELDHVKDYYETLGGIYLAKFIDKYKNLKMIEEKQPYTHSSSTKYDHSRSRWKGFKSCRNTRKAENLQGREDIEMGKRNIKIQLWFPR